MKKDVKNYSYKNLPQDDLELISKTCEDYAHAYNYFTGRYSGIRNLVNTSSVTSTRVNIRNVLYKDAYFRREVPIQVKLWKCALEDATSNIRSMWSNLFNKIRRKMYKNENLNNTQRHLINYLFTLKSELEKILNKKNPDIPEYFSEDISEEMFRKTCSLIRRYIRRYKPKKSINSKNRSYNLTSDMYKYVEKEGILTVNRPSATITDAQIDTGNSALENILGFLNKIKVRADDTMPVGTFTTPNGYTYWHGQRNGGIHQSFIITVSHM